MTLENVGLGLIDLGPKTGNLLREVLVGLSQQQKSIHPKFLYDTRGSELFEKICLLEEYYPTMSEKNILTKYSREIGHLIGREAIIIEPGAGAGEKVRLILHQIKTPLGYVPIEISKEILLRMVAELSLEFPELHVLPVCADFNQDLDLPAIISFRRGKKVVFFPGSTIGNLQPLEALQFMKKYGKLIGPGGGLLIGVDCKKNPKHFDAAYNDADGVTAAFNRNLLERLNREAGANFQPENFEHQAIYNDHLGRVEMHLRSRVAQLVRVNQTIFRFRKGETIHTENSYKYSPDEFIELCAKARFIFRKCWSDERKLFYVYYFERE